MKTAKNNKIDEFCRLPNYRVPMVIVRWNHHRSQKSCATAHENGQKWQNSRVLSTSKLPCTGCHGPLKSSPEPKPVCYSPRKRPEMTKFMSFVDFQITMYQGSWAVEMVPGAKTTRYSPRKRPEMIKSTSFVDFQITTYRGSKALKSSPEPKPVCYSLWKQKKRQNSRVLLTSKLPCTGGQGPLKTSQEPKTGCYSPWKRPKMTKLTSFVDFQITVYQGS